MQYPPYPHQQYPPPRTNALAIIAIICSILGLMGVPIVGSVLGIVLGQIAKKDISNSQGTQTGDSIAKVAIVIGWVGVILVVGVMILFFIFIWGAKFFK